MKNAINAQLQRFSKEILSLVPYAGNDRLGYLIEKLLPEENEARHLAIKNEIKKLAQQSTKIINLRPLFTDCEMVTHNNIVHYLDTAGKKLFNDKLIEYQNLYTIAIYLEVIEDAKKRSQNKKTQQPADKNKLSSFTIDKTEPKPLVNKNRINHEMKQLHSSCKVFVTPIMGGMTAQGRKETGITASIEKMNNHKVMIKTASEIQGINGDKLYLWLYDHHEEIDFEDELELGFTVLESQKSLSSHGVEYLLQFSSPLTEKQMRGMFLHYLKQKRSAIIGPTDLFVTPLYDSITSKGYEQLYLNKTHDIPLLCHKLGSQWHAKIAMKTSGNEELWHFFSDSDNFHLPSILGNTEIQAAMNARQMLDRYALVLKSSINNSVYFSLIWHDELQTNKRTQAIFKQYFRVGAFKVIKVSSSFIDAKADAYVPSALPCHVHPKIAVLNRATPKMAQDMISDCKVIITASDITSLYETIYAQINNKIMPLKSLLPKPYRVSKMKLDSDIEIVSAENDEARDEDRFVLPFNMAITRTNNVSTRIHGTTRNISIQGLLVTLEKETKFRSGEEIEIELTIPFASQERVLKKQKYVVLGTDNNGSIRLLINAIESKHLASRAIRKYLFQHLDHIKTCGARGSHIYGLQKAVRNIYAHNHFSIPFYLKATKHQQYINAASFSGNSALKRLVYKNDSSEKIILNLLSNKKFRDSCLAIIASLAYQKLSARAFYILVLPKNKNDKDDYSFWYRDLSVLKKSSQLKHYTDKVSKLGQPAILKIELKQSGKPKNMYYRDEVSFLRGLDKNLANDLERQLANTIGIGEVTDLTDIALDMIKAPQHI